MREIKTTYAYPFYFFYNSINKVKGNFLIKWKAIAMILMLEIFFIGSLVAYVIDIFKYRVSNEGSKPFMLAFVILLICVKFWFFERNENWRKYIKEFSKWPEKKQKKFNWLVRLIILFVALSFILSFYIMSQIDWNA